MKLAVFVGRGGVEKVLPAGEGGIEETDAAVNLYQELRPQIAAFDQAIRQRSVAEIKRDRIPQVLGSVT